VPRFGKGPGLAERVRAAETDDEYRALIRSLQEDPSAHNELERLLKDRDPVIRAWSIDAAPKVLPKADAVRIASLGAEDRDPDVRDVGVEVLMELGPDAIEAHALARRLIKQVRRHDQSGFGFAVWSLARRWPEDPMPDHAQWEASGWGARSSVVSGRRQVPALSDEHGTVRFDGYHEFDDVFIDRKWGIRAQERSLLQATRQARVLRTNAARTRWEVPDRRTYRRAKRLIDKADGGDVVVVVQVGNHL
jgi:hypothetical protein